MTPAARPTLDLDQLWYGWAQTTWSGRRGFGVVAASPGWEEHLRAGEDFLGPAVAFPDWSGGREPPASGGFALLRGIPTVFWRVPVATDGLNRPGSFAVRLAASWQRPLDALDAVHLLGSAALAGPPPPDAEPRLEPLTVTLDPQPPPGEPADGRAVVLLAALLEGLREGRQVVAAVPDEPTGRAVLSQALPFVPAALRRGWTFSSMQTGVEVEPFDLVLRVDGWQPGPAADRRPPDVDLVSGGSGALRGDVLRWAEQLVASGPCWPAGEEPGDVADLGRLLDVSHRAVRAPHALRPAEIADLARTTVAADWAGRPGASAAAARALREATPDEADALVAAAGRPGALGDVLVDAAWRVVETDPDGSAGVGTAEALLLATGAAADDVDLAQVRRLPPTPRAYGVEDSRRILRTLARRAGSLDAADWALLGCLAWDSSSRAEHPRLWLQTVMTAPTYLGAPLDNGEVARLPRGAVPAALSRAVADGVDPVEAGRRLAGVLPRSPSQRAALLVQLSHAPEHGMTATFLGALTARTTTVADQAAVLRQRWPDFVDEAGLPPYLATALAPRGTPGARLRLSRRGVLVLALLLLVVAVVAVLALTTWLPRG